jgi:manganese transport protein
MALLLQSLSARLGIVRRRDLAQASREAYPSFINLSLYILAELAIAATDLAEVLGMAIGIHLLTGLPLLWGTIITVLDTFLFLLLQRYGIRRMEAFIIALVATIGFSFLFELFLAKPRLSQVVTGFVPSVLTNESLYIAVGIIGATVMPHNLYLHSALVQTRKISTDQKGIRRAIKYNFVDSFVALNAAFLVNAAILILAATVFFTTGNTHVARIEDAHQLLQPLLGTHLAPVLFAVALIAAGQSSTVTGTLAGQIVMEGYLKLRLNPWLRRLLTRLVAIIPAVIVIVVFGDKKVDDLLILSQVLLSLQLGFAVIPLIHFVSDRETMGAFAISLWTKVTAWLVAVVLVFLNVKLVAEMSMKVFEANGIWVWKILLAMLIIAFTCLFLVMTFLPVVRRRRQKRHVTAMHGDIINLQNLNIKPTERIAVSLDFSPSDEKLIAHAVTQGKKAVSYILLHVVESPSASYFGEASDDDETRRDRDRLQAYAKQLQQMGYTVDTILGYRNRVAEIIRIVKASRADLLVMGAHRHSGLKDYIFGETIEGVRHALHIPVLVVNV